MRNYYEILEISPSASESVIKAAYKALVKKYHPDNDDQGNMEIICQINEAYECLSVPEKKKIYDDQLFASNSFSNQSCQRSGDCNAHDPDSFSKRDEEQCSQREAHRKSFFSQIISGAVDGVQDALDKRKQRIENVYLSALNMPDRYLISEYKNSYGAERIGYAKVLSERGYLKKDRNGQWVPTEQHKRDFWYGD